MRGFNKCIVYMIMIIALFAGCENSVKKASVEQTKQLNKAIIVDVTCGKGELLGDIDENVCA